MPWVSKSIRSCCGGQARGSASYERLVDGQRLPTPHLSDGGRAIARPPSDKSRWGGGLLGGLAGVGHVDLAGGRDARAGRGDGRVEVQGVRRLAHLVVLELATDGLADRVARAIRQPQL